MYKTATVVSNGWFRYVTFFLFLLVVIFILVVLAFKAEADVAIFYSDTYTEQGVEIVDESGTNTHVQYDYVWTDFKGSVPDDVAIDNVMLHFSWSSVTRSVVVDPVEEIPVATTSEIVAEQAPLDEISSQEEQVGESVTEEVVSENESEAIEASEPEPEQNLELNENVTIPSDSQLTAPASSESVDEEVRTEELILESVPIEDSSSLNNEGFEPVSWNQLYMFANAQLEEGIATDTAFTVETVNAEVMIAESISTTSGYVSPDIIVESLDERSFEVRYTTDGVTWNVLGLVGFDDAHESVFDLSHISLEELPNLQIAVRYTIPEGDQTKIIFDSVRLEVTYTELLIEEVVEPIIPNDNEPNFEVSSIKADVQSENIRAVMLERGGVFEFWYSLTENSSGEVAWSRLVGGSAIDESAPIAIKERTIFWLDRNQQTLFGFSVDGEALFGVPFQNPEEKVFQLPFQDDNAASWEATFNSDLNTLEFHKIRKGSS